jgi:hypothetical protein
MCQTLRKRILKSRPTHEYLRIRECIHAHICPAIAQSLSVILRRNGTRFIFITGIIVNEYVPNSYFNKIANYILLYDFSKPDIQRSP